MAAETDRKFDTWECYEDGVTPKRFILEIRYKRNSNAFEGATFYTKCDNPKVYAEDGDITKLKEKVMQQVREFYSATWEPMLLVTFDPGPEHRPTSERKLGLKITRFERAMLDGKEAFRAMGDDTFPGWGNEYGHERNSKQIVFISPAEKHKYGDEHHKTAILKDTPENREKLAALLQGFALLRERLLGLIDADLEQKLVGFAFPQLGAGKEQQS